MKRLLLIITFLLALCEPFVAPSFSQFNGCSAGFCSVVVPSGCSQATAFLARNGNANAAATTTFICGGVTDGWWPKWDILYIHGTDTSAHALLNWVSSSFNETNSGSLSFVANQGFTGDGTNALDTGWIAAVNGINYTLNNASAFVCILNNRTSTGNLVSFGASDNAATSYSLLVPFDTAGTRGDLNGPTGPAVVGATGTQGSWLMNRTSSSNVDVYLGSGSTKLGFITTTSISTVADHSFFEFSYHTIFGASNPTTDQQAAFGVGGGFTGTDWANFQARLHAYMVAVNGSGC